MGSDPVRAALGSKYVRRLLSHKAHQLLRRPEFRRCEALDLEQDLVAHVLGQADRFDPTRAGPGTFISRVLDSAAAMMCRDRGRLKRAGGHGAQSLDGTLLKAEGRQTPLSQTIDEADLCRRLGTAAPRDQDRAELACDLTDALAALEPHLREVAVRMADGTEASVARELGISRRQLRKAVAAIRRHLEGAGLGEF